MICVIKKNLKHLETNSVASFRNANLNMEDKHTLEKATYIFFRPTFSQIHNDLRGNKTNGSLCRLDFGKVVDKHHLRNLLG